MGTMKVSEPVAAYASTMFDTVISYLHSSQMPMETKRAVYLQLQAEVADENLGYMKPLPLGVSATGLLLMIQTKLSQLAGQSYMSMTTEKETKYNR